MEFVCTKVLPLCTRYPGPRSVLVLDNTQIYYSAVRMPSPHLYPIKVNCLGVDSAMRGCWGEVGVPSTLFTRFQPNWGSICRIESMDPAQPYPGWGLWVLWWVLERCIEFYDTETRKSLSFGTYHDVIRKRGLCGSYRKDMLIVTWNIN